MKSAQIVAHISTHILDTTLGVPAQGVPITLEALNQGQWAPLESGVTNADGRLVFQASISSGDYRLTFGTQSYFTGNQREHFFLDPQIGFRIQSTARNYHVPLLLNPYGFSTYRGS
jgi:5-hydroxyisourate hydrolase